MKMTIFNAFLSKAAHTKVMTISLGEKFGSFILFKGKILTRYVSTGHGCPQLVRRMVP